MLATEPLQIQSKRPQYHLRNGLGHRGLIKHTKKNSGDFHTKIHA
jgi:hypothetical protein